MRILNLLIARINNNYRTFQFYTELILLLLPLVKLFFNGRNTKLAKK